MLTIKEVQKIIQAVRSSYLIGHPGLIVEYHISEDLFADSLTFCENTKYKTWLSQFDTKQIEETRKYNGLYLPPSRIDSTQHILISSAQVDDNCSFISTVAHETKHALNRTGFCRKYCYDDIDLIFDHELSRYFEVWDEYSARKMGHAIYCTVTMPQVMGYSDAEIRSHMIEHELPIRKAEINSIVQSDLRTVERIIETFGIIARLSVWKKLFDIDLSGVPNFLLDAMLCFDENDDIEALDLYAIRNKLDDLVTGY
jgi:hypothetical protein